MKNGQTTDIITAAATNTPRVIINCKESHCMEYNNQHQARSSANHHLGLYLKPNQFFSITNRHLDLAPHFIKTIIYI